MNIDTNSADFLTPAHEFGHLLGLSDLYTHSYDPNAARNEKGELDASHNENLGRSWEIHQAGRGNLMGDTKTGRLEDWQIEDIVGSSINKAQASGVRSTSILRASSQIEKAEQSARRHEFEAEQGCTFTAGSCMTSSGANIKITREDKNWLKADSTFRRGQSSWKRDGEILTNQLKALRAQRAGQ